MKLHELSDKELDEIFRKASESTDYPVKEGAWARLSSKLDGWDTFNRSFWRLLGGGILLLLLVTPILLWTNSALVDSNGSGIRSNIVYGEIISIPFNQEDPGLGNKNTRQEPEKNLQTLVMDPQNNQMNESTQETDVDKEQNLSPVYPNAYPETAEAMQKVKKDEEPSLYHPGRTAPVFTEVKRQDYPEKKEFYGFPDEVLLPIDQHQFHISLDLSIGPDFSVVGSNAIGSGTYVGLLVDLNPVRRLHILSGVYHTRKRYPVEDEYTAPYPGFWTNGQAPDRVNVACHIIDIPLNFQFDILEEDRYRIFLGTGLSSYLMLTEEYNFEYGYSYDPSLVKDYVLRNENQHYFGVVNLSAGYTNYINQRWAWQIEPFYKLPIQDIAAAKVRLNSFGGFVSLKYRIR